MEDEIKTPSYGPALGVGVSYAFNGGFFAAANLSGLYMWGYFELSDEWRYNYTDFTTHSLKSSGSFRMDTRQIGLNFEPAVGYRSEIGIIVTLGLRYQWCRTESIDNFPGETKPLADANDYLYGVFTSILYSF